MKRIIFSILILCFGVSLSLFLYVYLQPDKTAIYAANIKNSEEMMLSSVNVDNTDYIYNEITAQIESGINHFYFYSSNDRTCQYLDLNIIKPLARSINEESFYTIADIDLVNIIGKEYAFRDIESDFQFSSFPVYLTINLNEDGSLEVSNQLQYDETKPFSQTDIKNWMLDNDCWIGPVEEVATPIAEVED
jgi:uncharacterized protein YxeA